MESVMKSNDERALHKREYDSRVNERQMLTTEGKVDVSNALDASLLVTESNGIEFRKHDTNSSSGNDGDADDADIKPVYDEEPMAKKTDLQSLRNQSVVRQPIAFKSKRPKSLKLRFASQVDVKNNLSKPVTTLYLPKEREYAFAKPHHMITPGSSRYSSNDIVHNHYLEEAKKKTQERGRNSRPSVMPSARS
uniref:Uncharacterized protein n=1 Tax=Tanacetum cinerariifolium TaxID=118510 RepID=A0A6L2NHT7_TANCI|nr:hypothetical protein [Tanacetum cinerariifolium]